jgi:hypothetical protein
LWRGVEEPVPRVAEGTPGVLNVPIAARSFSTTEVRQQDLLRYAEQDARKFLVLGPREKRATGPGGRKASSSNGYIKHPRGSLGYSRDRLFDSAPQALYHATNL